MGNTLASEMHHGHQQSSSSNTENMNKNKSTTPRRGSPPPPSLPPALGLLRKGSSFLDAPITHKLTERGDATVSLSCSNRSISSTSSGREGSDSSSSDDVSNSSYNKLRYAVSEMQGWRSHMEDKHALNPDLSVSKLSTNDAHQKQQHAKLLEDHHLFAVFDGHGGDFASQYCGTHLVETLTSQKDWVAYLQLCDKKKNSPKQASVKGLQLLKSALTSTFLSLDEQLMTAQRKIRVSQLSKMENLVASYGGKPKEHDVFTKGTADYERIMNFDRQLPASMPPGIPLERSGSTGVVVLLTPTHIICANAGDSRAILGRKKQQKGSSNDDGVLPLSFDHKPANDVEVSRVEKDGGFVRNGRVDGDLAVSRSFGDFGYKNCSERLQMFERQKSNGSTSTASTVSSSSSSSMSTPSQHRVAVHPDILVYTRDPSKDEFVVLACDGIWDRLTNKDCSDLVKSLIHDDGETDVGLVCEEVIDTALELDSRDNMTCCVVLFPGHQQQNHLVHQPSSQSLSSSTSSGVMKRRYEREQSWGRDSTPAKRAQHRLEERRKHHRELLAQQKAKLTVTNKIQVLRGRASSAAAATASSIPSKKARLVSPMKNKKTESDGTTRQ